MNVHFDPEQHIYTVDGVQLPSVTEVCRFLAYDYKSAQPWLAEAAARRGTAVHEACALIDYGEIPEETPEIAGYLKAYRRFLADYAPEWELIEHPMGHTKLGFAGTLDRYGVIDGETAIVDIKTGQLHDAALSAQLTGYKCLLYLDPLCFTTQALYALKLSNDSTYELRRVEESDELLRACLFIHKAVTKKGKKK